MKTVILYGHLGKKFGKVHRFDVRNAREAISALRANFEDFAPHVLAHNEPGYHILVDGEKQGRDVDQLNWPAEEKIKIVPAVVGAKGGLGALILGAALIVAAPYAAGWLLQNTAMVGLSVGIATYAPTIGWALVAAGVSQMLSPSPKSQSTETKTSYAFNGPANTTTQGQPVPVCYGRLIVGSCVVSGGMDTVDVAI